MSRRNNAVKVDERHPQAQAICDRCGFRYNHHTLAWQHEWSGETLYNTRLLVCRTCLDQPNETLRTYNPGADPLPIRNPRFENVDMD
jgi:hypothetical protein